MKTKTATPNYGVKSGAKKVEAKSQRRPSAAPKEQRWAFPFEKKNYIFAAIGIGVILLGYLLMYTGVTEEPALPDGKWNNPMAVVIAPILLIIGYCVIIPYSLMKFFSKK